MSNNKICILDIAIQSSRYMYTKHRRKQHYEREKKVFLWRHLPHLYISDMQALRYTVCIPRKQSKHKRKIIYLGKHILLIHDLNLDLKFLLHDIAL